MLSRHSFIGGVSGGALAPIFIPKFAASVSRYCQSRWRGQAQTHPHWYSIGKWESCLDFAKFQRQLAHFLRIDPNPAFADLLLCRFELCYSKWQLDNREAPLLCSKSWAAFFGTGLTWTPRVEDVGVADYLSACRQSGRREAINLHE